MNKELKEKILELIEISGDPDCECEYQHDWSCDAMKYRTLAKEIREALKKL
jgi:hypothetical protein